MNGIFNVVMGERGRIVVPSAVRERAGLAQGTPMVLVESSDGVLLLTRRQLRARVRHDLEGLSLVDELLAERRLDAEREDKHDPGGPANGPANPTHAGEAHGPERPVSEANKRESHPGDATGRHRLRSSNPNAATENPSDDGA